MPPGPISEDTARIQAELSARHPWCAAELETTAGATYAALWTLPLPLEDAWTLLSDTSRLNRALRVPPVVFEERGGQRTGSSVYFGQRFAWEEPPWEWNAPELIVCRKAFPKGPVRSMFSMIDLQAAGEHTEVRLWYGWIGSGWMGSFARKRLVAFLRSAFRELMPQMSTDEPMIRLSSTKVAGGEARATDAAREAGRHAERLAEHVLYGDPITLDRLRMFALADAWAVDRNELLHDALVSTEHGMLLARWDVICPHCRGVRASLESLDALTTTVSCEVCDVLFKTESAGLELTFRVHPAVRSVQPRIYCAAEPATKPHQRLQMLNHSAREVRLPLRPQTLVLRDGTFQIQATLTVEPGGVDRFTVGDGEAMTVAPGALLTLPGTETRWVLEGSQGSRDAVQPRDVLSLAAYRAVMGAESLAPDMALEVGVQTLLFTDVVASTALYQTLGDRDAFDAVRAHFRVIFGLVRREGGAVIKTIGDAVMAAFSTPEAAARAAMAIATQDLAPIQVRLSLHTGRCIAVNLDTGVDYFGAVVNEAAKLQAAAGPGEVAISLDQAQAMGIQGTPARYTCGTDQRDAILWVPTPDTSTPAPIRRG